MHAVNIRGLLAEKHAYVYAVMHFFQSFIPPCRVQPCRRVRELPRKTGSKVSSCSRQNSSRTAIGALRADLCKNRSR